jgi:hypothetical protein
MGYFDGIAATRFKETEDGDTIYYPWMVKGGYVVPKKLLEQVRASNKKETYGLFFPLIILAGTLPIALPLIAIQVLFYRWREKKLVAGMQPSDIKSSRKEKKIQMIEGIGWIDLIFFQIASIAMFVGSLWVIFTSYDQNRIGAGYLGILFGGFCIAQFWLMISKKLHQK